MTARLDTRLQESLPSPVLPGKWDLVRVQPNQIPLQEIFGQPLGGVGRPAPNMASRVLVAARAGPPF
jgi:hypothetical protein